jgi:hypothetical protein
VSQLPRDLRGDAQHARAHPPAVRDDARRELDGWGDPHIHESLDLGQACQGCKNDCPINVDVATYKAEFPAHHYYEGRLRPAPAYAMGLIHEWARLAALAPGIANTLSQAPVTARLLKRVGGLAPQRARRLLQADLRALSGAIEAGTPVVRQTWVIAEGYIPSESTGPAPQMTSHETACLRNTGDREARVQITIYYANRDPGGPYSVVVPARRTLHLRFNNLRDPEPIRRDTDCSSVIESDVPIVVQHTRLDSRQSAAALLSTIAFAP